jgi:hypothetical protein
MVIGPPARMKGGILPAQARIACGAADVTDNARGHGHARETPLPGISLVADFTPENRR